MHRYQIKNRANSKERQAGMGLKEKSWDWLATVGLFFSLTLGIFPLMWMNAAAALCQL